MVKTKLYLFSLLLLLYSGIISCYHTQPLYLKDYSGIYSLKQDKPEGYFQVFHHQDVRSTVYFYFNTKGFLLAKPLNELYLKGKFSVSYKMFNSAESARLLDSATYTYTFPENSTCYKDSFTVPIARGEYYVLELEVTDLNKHLTYNYFIELNKTNKRVGQNYQRVLTTCTPAFLSKKDELVTLKYGVSTPGKWVIKHLKTDLPLPTPPFSTNLPKEPEFKTDTLFTLEPINGLLQFKTSMPGLYIIGADSLNSTGFKIYCGEDFYPEISTLEQMITPVRYITMRNEFGDLIQAQDKKEALDKFWLDLTSSKERSKELIKQYYNRVVYANKHFTTVTEGWRTDRGMIFLVFGPPNYISKNSNGESWIYGDPNSYRNITFNFFRNTKSVFYENDFYLDRNPMFKDDWMRAVDTWRQGRVYNPF